MAVSVSSSSAEFVVSSVVVSVTTDVDVLTANIQPGIIILPGIICVLLAVKTLASVAV